MNPDEAERQIQQAYLNGQEILKVERRRKLKILAAACVRAARVAWKP